MMADVTMGYLPFIIPVLLVIVLIVVITIVLKKKKSTKIVVDPAFVEQLVSLLGGKMNIKSVTVDNARLKFDVVDVEAVDLSGLQSVSENGVFVTGNVVKTLFKYDSKKIKDYIEKM